MKGITDTGITFFTNYGSRKAQELVSPITQYYFHVICIIFDLKKKQAENPNVAITFYWLPLRRQVRIEGVATKISKEESELYFHQRPRASQIGAVASEQSKPITSRDYLDDIEAKLKEKFGADDEIPMPNW